MSSFLTNNDYLIISRLLKFFSTSYGANARLKLIQTVDNSMSICTSISSRIQHQLKCRHLISRLLSAAIQKQTSIYHDGGLYFSIIFCSFLIQCRELSMNAAKQNLFFQCCLNFIDEMNIPKETITFNSIHQLVAIVRAVICKSLAYNNSDLLREKLCLLSVKSFLENITMINSSTQQLILTIQGLSIHESTLFNGLLYQISTSKSYLCSKKIRSCLYFTISLAGDYIIEDLDHIETETQMFKWIQNTAERITKQILEYTCLHNGGLILCQKVIHPSVKTNLRKYGIDTIDRLGRQYTPYLCYLTDCQPIETLTFNTIDKRYFGTVTEIKEIKIEKKTFLQFFNENRPFHTLLLCANTEQALLELKESITASHHTLTNILLTKQGLYGGGCSESIQIHLLKNQMNQLSARYLSKIFQNIIRAQYDHDYLADRVHGHLWYLLENDQISKTCACELYSISDQCGIEWRKLFFYLDDEQQEDKMSDNDQIFIRNLCPKYLDNFHMRTSALRTAIETAINLHLTSICL
ncbi:unnamed protein product [Rotaria socialis]|uniref:Uncharacterized protein n=1 Tax=Rotaria socialis TaxID=392032 RepID=A0A818DIJ8_9BILA|nr:unnamed protein product [Rotaria socialis]CAF4583216.1 unnamed protein product [Rotaria socialis]